MRASTTSTVGSEQDLRVRAEDGLSSQIVQDHATLKFPASSPDLFFTDDSSVEELFGGNKGSFRFHWEHQEEEEEEKDRCCAEADYDQDSAELESWPSLCSELPPCVSAEQEDLDDQNAAGEVDQPLCPSTTTTQEKHVPFVFDTPGTSRQQGKMSNSNPTLLKSAFGFCGFANRNKTGQTRGTPVHQEMKAAHDQHGRQEGQEGLPPAQEKVGPSPGGCTVDQRAQQPELSKPKASQYSHLRQIGNGAYATVWLAVKKTRPETHSTQAASDPCYVAVKEISRVDAEMTERTVLNTWNERNILKKLTEEQVGQNNAGSGSSAASCKFVYLLDSYTTASSLYLVLELANHSSVFEHLKLCYKRRSEQMHANTPPEERCWCLSRGAEAELLLTPCKIDSSTSASTSFADGDGGNKMSSTNTHEGDATKTRIPAWEWTFAKAEWCAREIATALKYLHERKIAYRDMKLTNVMVDIRRTTTGSTTRTKAPTPNPAPTYDGGGTTSTERTPLQRLVLVDFGFATDDDAHHCTHVQGTMRTMAPEIVFLNSSDKNDSTSTMLDVEQDHALVGSGSPPKTYDGFRADIWSFACVVYELFAVGRHLLPGYFEDLEIDTHNYRRELERTVALLEQKDLADMSTENRRFPNHVLHEERWQQVFWFFLKSTVKRDPAARPANMIEVCDRFFPARTTSSLETMRYNGRNHAGETDFQVAFSEDLDLVKQFSDDTRTGESPFAQRGRARARAFRLFPAAEDAVDPFEGY
ncbi:unnamed protein product [Amoebophrya sp. A120]|nr:unnamed protein product [Amoebophrya sp. A120]|eukprot:GSA120T00025756001.1